MDKYDAIIIGFGKGGKTLAADLANRNWKVAVVERSAKMYGGTCINIGCIPTKSLVHQSKQGEIKQLNNFADQKNYYETAIENKNQLISFLRQKNFDNLDSKENITVFTGKASFQSAREVVVQTETESIVLSAEKIFINTGAETIIPNIKGLKESKSVYTSTSIMELSQLPKRLAIIGGGYIGLEFASMYSGFGSEVTVIEGSSTFIPREDRDIAGLVKEALEKKHITIKMSAKVQEVREENNETIISYNVDGDTYELAADAILLATGRKPNVDGLNLEAAGVEIDERGAIKVDSTLRTSVPHIWAIGDVKGGLQFTYISLDDYRIIKNDLFGNKQRQVNDRTTVPYSVFIDPPLSNVGLGEDEAREKGYDIKVAKLPAAGIPRARLINETTGLMKAIVDAKTNKILGCSLFCAESSEIINIVDIAMKTGQDYTFLRDHIFTHPTMSEALNDLFSQIK
ncbi:FAD-dependent oxidoreductase [Bacillus massiliigorillae]|uniref:FAD-dependent oxidoreductase n=1 Tax=Bacillus massiliigorillae TaxID=1243664 RepID=UPI0003A90C5F|nr:FAD-dependent oxidoreductase [Bacillus massiliigorillae]